MHAPRVHARAFALALLVSAAPAAAPAIAAAPQRQAAIPQGPAADAAADARDKQPAQSIVRGRVVFDDTGRPVRRAAVRLYDPAEGVRYAGMHMAWTDGRGEFVLRDVPAGRFYVIVDAPGVTRQLLDAPESNDGATAVTVDGRGAVEVKVRVRRGGAISGTVTYSDGDPAAGAIVTLRVKKDGRLEPFYASPRSEGLRTDDRGRYRVSGLPPGEYVVSASEQKTSVGRREEEGGVSMFQSALSTAFYGGATSPQQATPVRVEAGGETEEIDITLVERATHAVSGTVVERGTQRPIARAEVSLSPKDGGPSEPYTSAPTAHTDEQGRWWLDEVPDGAYVLMAVPRESYDGMSHRLSVDGAAAGPKPPRPKFVIKRQELTVAGGDVAGVVVEVSSGGRVSGTVAVEGGKRLPPDLLLMIEPADPAGPPRAYAPAPVGPGGTFTFDGVPAGPHVFAQWAGQDGSLYIKAVTSADGADLLHTPFSVDDGDSLKGVRVLMSADVATLSGRVLEGAGGKPLRGAQVVLIPADPARRRSAGARLYAMANADGGYSVSGAPGEYLALALRAGVSPYGLRGEALEARLAAAPRVTLAPAERKSLDLPAPAAGQ